MRRFLSTMSRRFRDSRSWITASTTKAPPLCQRIPVAAFSRGAGVLGIAPPTPKLNGFMRHLQRKRTPLATTGRFRRQNPARNATQCRRFPRSAKQTANDCRRKPHRSPGPMAKSAPISCETAQKSRGRARRRTRNRKTPGLFSKQMGKVQEFSRSYAIVLMLTPYRRVAAFAHIDDQHANHRNPPPWSLLPGIQPRTQERTVGMSRMVSMSQAHHPPCSSRTPPMKS